MKCSERVFLTLSPKRFALSLRVTKKHHRTLKGACPSRVQVAGGRSLVGVPFQWAFPGREMPLIPAELLFIASHFAIGSILINRIRIVSIIYSLL